MRVAELIVSPEGSRKSYAFLNEVGSDYPHEETPLKTLESLFKKFILPQKFIPNLMGPPQIKKEAGLLKLGIEKH